MNSKRTPPDETQLLTPDGRYFIVRGRLRRAPNPNLEPLDREWFDALLGEGRRDLARAKKRSDPSLAREVRVRINEIKRSLGLTGAVWWTDGEPDLSRRLVHNTPYADWYAALAEKEKMPVPE